MISRYTIPAFIFKWLNLPEVLDFQGDAQQVMEHFIYNGVNHKLNRELASKFGVIVTQVKVFPTDSGWIILDKYTKRLLHKELKEQEVEELCRRNNYQRN